jgi:uncharacterized protein (DUF2252 family)
MAPRRPPVIAAFDAPIPSPQERRLVGKQLRANLPRSRHSEWEPPSDRRDPIEVLIESNRGRMEDLIPLRYARMSVSPFTFLRGSAQVMAYDLASGTSTDLEVRLCGDAHLSNFGAFASPERRLMFDLNDFDEASPGPFEWDVKRLAVSVDVAARDNGFDPDDTRRAVLEAVTGYRDWMQRYAGMTHLEVWYARIEMRDLLDTMQSFRRKDEVRLLEKAESKDHVKALNKLTTIVDGRRQILDDPPIVMRIRLDPHDQPDRVVRLVADYRASLTADRQELLDRYRFVDFARKVVGVGSVGTRCWIALFQGPNGAPLFLQLKEAQHSVVNVALGVRPPRHQGQRVVDGQRALQAASDVLLGWGTDPETRVDYYLRQLWDAKGSVDITTLRPSAFNSYAALCGWALARAHARTSDSATLTGYLGRSDRFAEALSDFAEAYAAQTELDHAALLAAIERGVVPTGDAGRVAT